MEGARPFSRVGSAVGDRPGSTVLGRPMTSGSGAAAGGGRVGTARGVPGTASRLVATAMQNRPASRGGGGNESNLHLLPFDFFVAARNASVVLLLLLLLLMLLFPVVAAAESSCYFVISVVATATIISAAAAIFAPFVAAAALAISPHFFRGPGKEKSEAC